MYCILYNSVLIVITSAPRQCCIMHTEYSIYPAAYSLQSAAHLQLYTSITSYFILLVFAVNYKNCFGTIDMFSASHCLVGDCKLVF